MSTPPVTPDGRYFVVRGRLWRRSDPGLPEAQRADLIRRLMAARRAKGRAMRAGDEAGRADAKAIIEQTKVALGERGPVWWTDGTPDWNRRMARNTPYAEWWAGVSEGTEQDSSTAVAGGLSPASGSVTKLGPA